MRTIKFRAWYDNGDGMVYFKQFPTDNLYANLMQYTGIKDKNGEEIYEGDIVIYDTDGGKKAKVIWKNGGFVFIYEDGIENITSESWYAPHDIPLTEIIGNIYENPDLLSTQPSQE